MKAALLSAGPSLRASYGPAVHDYKLVIGVNTAVQYFKCDWWACADQHRFSEICDAGVIGKPKLFMIDAQRDRALCFDKEKMKRFKVTGWDEVFTEAGASLKWADRTSIAALILAKWLKVTELHCYGVDMDGHLDATGIISDSTKYREPGRWQLERQLWTLVCGWVESHGVKVIRHAPESV